MATTKVGKPNGNKEIKILHLKVFQNVPKLGIWSEKKPSGNPDLLSQLKNTGRSENSANLVTLISNDFW
jgi:hypothetical protein